ncbi:MULTISPECIES: DUF5777 family beta-barrel protein [Flavobacterium]|jgi:hypothetical protein|uniref:DUF5777 family beta-barrel protein n=1 Tax=Flavobacterium TaxID=237 RepID=UPI0006FFED26|nr:MULTISPECIES: DUF5777 family beta-barrel protein [unclassified Flavobacterium]MCA1919542.1 DUF5777 family beta-barrel protein [Flavobacterium piscis]PAM95204.1 hypothetical protein B4N84_07985 [Flavobacterium sp. IR1]PTS97159.1 hypothetical protein DBR27_15605 [Flavobacterium sp. HMWF030]KQO22639.1 hypothetical protein ASF10_09725 [Flavobacterium sp. Leaf82]PWB27507.1 hypothetical protein DCO46_03065 [Flavobacterium sp. HTF]
MKKLILLLFLFPLLTYSQDDLLSGVEAPITKEKVASAFKALKIVNLESTKLAAKGDLYFVVAHRFGSIKDGFEGFYGLDNANTQIKFIYGLTPGINISAARSEFAYDFATKYMLLPQIKDGFPVTIAGFNSLSINNTLKESLYPKLEFKNRLTYVAQLLISRKFSEKLSLEIVPSFFHENFVLDPEQSNSQYAIGFGGRYKFAKRWSLNMDYAAHLNRASNSIYKNPLSIGFDLETGGHVFQMHFTSSQAIDEAGYLGRTTGDWTKGDIFFGFNLARVF